jgi:RNA polymerase primary sigma factor
MKEDVRRSLTTLTEREVDILYNHVMEESCTLSDLGVKYGLSRERIRQVEEEALKKLRFKLRNWKNFPDDDER